MPSFRLAEISEHAGNAYNSNVEGWKTPICSKTLSRFSYSTGKMLNSRVAEISEYSMPVHEGFGNMGAEEGRASLEQTTCIRQTFGWCEKSRNLEYLDAAFDFNTANQINLLRLRRSSMDELESDIKKTRLI